MKAEEKAKADVLDKLYMEYGSRMGTAFSITTFMEAMSDAFEEGIRTGYGSAIEELDSVLEMNEHGEVTGKPEYLTRAVAMLKVLEKARELRKNEQQN